MSNPKQRAKVAHMVLHDLNPFSTAVLGAYGLKCARAVVAQVAVVDGTPAAVRVGFVDDGLPTAEGARAERYMQDTTTKEL